MAINLSALREITRPLTITWPDAGELNLRYRPLLTTPAYLEEQRERLKAEADPDGWKAQIAEMVAMITEWDLLQDDGTPVPLTTEALRRLNTRVLNAIQSAIADDMTVNPPLSRPSETGSTPAAVTEPVPIGRRSSSSRKASG